MPGYDVLAHNLDTGKNCRIQVKYRKAINSDGMIVKNLDFDFAVYVAGNIGRIGQQVPQMVSIDRAEIFVIPKKIVERRLFGAKRLYRNPMRGENEQYLNAWNLIDEFLNIERP
jgi:hypothetical protein